MPTVTVAGALIGRDAEVAILAERLRQVSSGRGSVVLIEGEPGIGKSSLVRAALASAGAGCQVFWGAGDELGQPLPLLPLLDALRVREASVNPRRQAIVRLLRGEETADRATDVSAAVGEQLLALIAEQCALAPTVLVVDDLQWADQASIALWGRLARSARQVPLLLLGMSRPVPQRDDLLALRRAVNDAGRLHLAALTEEAVAELVADLAGGKPAGNLLRLADGAAGNPLYVTELVAVLARSARLTVTDTGVAEVTDGPAPSSLSGAIADRLGFVSRQVRAVLRAAALLGVDFDVPDLARVLGRSVADLVPAVDEALAVGVLAETAHGLGFRHPLIRSALYEEMPAGLRAAWHRDAARALAGAGAPVNRVARQLLRAVGGQPDTTEPVDDWLLSWLASNAGLLASQAPQVAAELLRHAVTGSPAGSACHDFLICRLAEALYRVGDADGAEDVANEALDRAAEPDVLVNLHWTLAECRMRVGRFAESLAALDRALTSPGMTARHRARLLVLAARTHSNLGEVEKAGRVASSALEAATEAGDTWAMGWALHVLTIVTAVQGQLTDALPLFDRALAVTRADQPLTDLRLLLEINKAVTLGNLDHFEEAFRAARHASHLADQAGMVIRQVQAHSALGQLLFDTGQWAEAMAEVAAVDDVLKEPIAACCDLGIAAVVRFHRGEVADARRHLAAAAPRARKVGNRVISPLALARSLDREQAGALTAALDALTEGFGDTTEELDEMEDLFADAVRLAMTVGDLRTAQALAGHAAGLATGSEIPHRQANALFCCALLDHDAHRLLEAAEGYGRAGRPLLRAKAMEAAAAEFVRTGDRGQARAAFTHAVEAFGSLGASADAARLQARFRALGIRRGPHVKHRRARSGWDSLTPAEATVAQLVQGGMSNPEIAAKLLLSRRTVATHVSHILKKLDVHSRIDIAREAALRSR